MQARSRLSILAALSAAVGVKPSLFEALEKMDAAMRAGGFSKAPDRPPRARRRSRNGPRRHVQLLFEFDTPRLVECLLRVELREPVVRKFSNLASDGCP
jgi:hypothetical protein